MGLDLARLLVGLGGGARPGKTVSGGGARPGKTVSGARPGKTVSGARRWG